MVAKIMQPQAWSEGMMYLFLHGRFQEPYLKGFGKRFFQDELTKPWRVHAVSIASIVTTDCLTSSKKYGKQISSKP